MNSEPHNKTSECREHFQKSQISEETAVVRQAGEVVPWMIKRSAHISNSKDREPSQNSRVQEARTDTGNVDMTVVNHCGQCSTRVSESREHFSNLQMESEASQGAHQVQNAKNACISEPSESSRDSPGGVGNNVSVPKFSWIKGMSQIVRLTAAW